MSVHSYVLEAAGEMKRRADVEGLDLIVQAQIDYKRDRLRADDLKGRKRRKAHEQADIKFRESVAAAVETSRDQRDAS